MPPVTQNAVRPIVLSGPSGTGKSTLLKRLFDEHPGRFGFSISHTTRKPRPGESNGVEYHFVSKPDFEDLIKQNAFIEHAQFSGNYYGTSAKAVQDVADKGSRCILDIDSQGVKLIKANHPHLNPVYVFLSPPSISELKARLSGRGTESQESIDSRLAMSKSEIAYAKTGAYDLVVVNDNVENAYQKLKNIAVNNKIDSSDVLPPLEDE